MIRGHELLATIGIIWTPSCASKSTEEIPRLGVNWRFFYKTLSLIISRKRPPFENNCRPTAISDHLHFSSAIHQNLDWLGVAARDGEVILRCVNWCERWLVKIILLISPGIQLTSSVTSIVQSQPRAFQKAFILHFLFLYISQLSIATNLTGCKYMCVALFCLFPYQTLKPGKSLNRNSMTSLTGIFHSLSVNLCERFGVLLTIREVCSTKPFVAILLFALEKSASSFPILI